ncbi:hypothetical protein BDBG_18010, partial [Blastomyces gilchristii SLH14081]
YFILIYIKFSHVDRSTSADDSEYLNIELLIKNLKNMIMKKLFILYITESLTSLSTLSVSFSVTLSQSLISVSVSDSPASAISVSVTFTLTTSALSASTVSAFIISSSHFKKMLYRLNKSYFSRITLSLSSVKIIITSASEIILIKDDYITETTLFHSQASSVTFSFFSVKKIVCISNYKYSTL